MLSGKRWVWQRKLFELDEPALDELALDVPAVTEVADEEPAVEAAISEAVVLVVRFLGLVPESAVDTVATDSEDVFPFFESFILDMMKAAKCSMSSSKYSIPKTYSFKTFTVLGAAFDDSAVEADEEPAASSKAVVFAEDFEATSVLEDPQTHERSGSFSKYVSDICFLSLRTGMPLWEIDLRIWSNPSINRGWSGVSGNFFRILESALTSVFQIYAHLF